MVGGYGSNLLGHNNLDLKNSVISFLENNFSMFSHSAHFQIGNGQPQNLSLDIHHGCFSLIISWAFTAKAKKEKRKIKNYSSNFIFMSGG